MKCQSGRHEWTDPIGAERCCDPDWTRELRFGYADMIEGDDDEGITVVHGGGGLMYVWHVVERDEIELERMEGA